MILKSVLFVMFFVSVVRSPMPAKVSRAGKIGGQGKSASAKAKVPKEKGAKTGRNKRKSTQA